MPFNGYDDPLTLAAGVNRFVTLLQAALYTGRFGFTSVTIRNNTGASVYFARRSDVSDAGATKGREIESGESYTFPSPGGKGSIDFNKMYIYSAAGGEIYFDGSTR
jgi:hypothetical protein